MNVVLHIGTYKTGSTSIQLWLRDHPLLLAEVGARFPYGWLRRDNHLELALGLMRRDRLSPARMRGVEWEDDAWCGQMLGQVTADLVAHQDETTILSAEDTMLLRSDAELRALRALIGDAHVVVYLRDPDGFLDAWEDTLLGKLDLPLSDDPSDFNCVEADSHLVDYGHLVEQWSRHFTKVTVFNYDRIGGSVIPSFAALLGVTAPGPIDRYWLNGRGGGYTHREPGLRWTCGLPFGSDPEASPVPSLLP